MTRKNVATSKVSPKRNPAYDWAVALDQYLDLHADLMQCRDALPPGFDMSLLPVRTHTGKDFIQYDAALSEIQAQAPSMPPDLAERGSAVLHDGIKWLRLRYDGLWSNAPIPKWFIDPLIQRAIGSSKWVEAYECTNYISTGAVAIGPEEPISRALHQTYAEVRAEADDHQPAWTELDENRFVLPHDKSEFTTVTLYISHGADKDDAVEALTRAWPHIEQAIGRPLGKQQPKPGKRAGGRLPNYMEYVTLYQAWNDWRKEHGPHDIRGFYDAVLDSKIIIPHWKDKLPYTDAGIKGQLSKARRMFEPDSRVPARLEDYIEQTDRE